MRSRQLCLSLLTVVMFLVVVPGCSDDAKSPSSRSSSTETPAKVVPTLPAPRIALIESALNAPQGAVARQVLAPQALGPGGKPKRLLPVGSTATIQGEELDVDGDVATMPVTVTGGAVAGSWLLLFTRVNGQWLLYGTSRA